MFPENVEREVGDEDSLRLMGLLLIRITLKRVYNPVSKYRLQLKVN